MKSVEKQLWDETALMLGDRRTSFSDHWSFNFRNDPKRMGFVLSRYKFSAKMACRKGKILELGCSSGIGAPILAEKAESYTGVDLEEQALVTAQCTFSPPKFTFIHDDFMGKSFGRFDAVVSLDVVEHILPEYETLYFDTILQNLGDEGICVVGTPNITASPYASEYSKMGHVNLYSQERLVDVMRNYFHQVFPFGMNDEIMHTGYAPMAHYLLCVGCHRKDIS
jgi:2-polyprenyl-3-methyl-5-hydroxy-6-metoxy-1,4-benzoquinol methylase